ncbi:hypothetical protein [Halalkalibacter urbisdiaboli]|uniref:hypothetical protein n=1 Tax=Halalkalibacter urbisdiaboli TaxID=1960589 RepID=UPI000B43C258|nr:hypothetical protein [Halalkalibacter urbisdiaboli]
MIRVRTFIGICFILVSIYFYLLALMHMFPLYFAGPLLFFSILFTLKPLSNRKRFKGFKGFNGRA